MTNTSKRAPQGSLKSAYEHVTQQIVSHLEQGVVPWQSPHIATVGFPKNFQSGKAYSGINVMLLGMAGYLSPYFLTYKQALERGGHVRKGERGHLVVKFGTYASKNEDDKEDTRMFLRHYTAFNACQIEGIEFPEPALPGFASSGRTERAKAIVSAMPLPPAIHEGEKALTCYDPQSDRIDIPPRASFESEERFYKSLFHEIVHATGAAKRLARKTLLENKGRLGGDEKIYSKEELVAEIGAAFLCAHAGIVIDDHRNSAAYLQTWLKVLKNDSNKRWIVEAAGQAQKAVNFVLNVEG